METQKNLFRHPFHLTREMFATSYKHTAKVVWLTGLSGSGKSTLANVVSKLLFEGGVKTFVLDGDKTRLGINKDLGFSLEDRKENIRRAAEIARLFIESGTVVLTAFISPVEKDRKMAREIIGASDMIEVFLDCPLETCEQRDIKGLYSKARAGQILNFTGINSPYEKPSHPDLSVDTANLSVEECAQEIYSFIRNRIHQA